MAAHPSVRRPVHRQRTMLGAQRRPLCRCLWPGLAAMSSRPGRAAAVLGADFAKQRDLSIGRALPVELLGISAGGGPLRRLREEVADRPGKLFRRNPWDDAAS